MTAFFKTYSLSIASGVVLALCFPGWHLYPLAWAILVPLLVRCWSCSPRQAAGHFFLAGMSFYLVLLQWLMSNVYWAGGWAFWGYAGLCIIMSLYWALLGTVWVYVRGTSPRVPAAAVLALLWMAMEFLQATAFTGFGWGALGYSQGKDLYLIQWAALGGVSLVSGILVLVNALLAGVVAERRFCMMRLTAAAAIAAGVHGAGYLLAKPALYGDLPFQVGLLQADFPLEMKWDPEYTVDMVANAAEKSRMLDQSTPVSLVVWPESLIMDDVEVPEILEEIQSLTRDIEAPLFAGTHRTNRDTSGSMNSSVLVEADGTVADFYDKIHLAPFGEYVPLSEWLPFISKVVPAIGDIEAGTVPKTLQTGKRRIGPLICFEVLFAPMAARLRDEGADLLVVITNLGWFGSSSAVSQELEVARLRAVETRLPLAHCANTGISGMFDPYGRFSLIDIYFDGHGNAYRMADIGPEATRMHRLGGVLPAALPAPHPLPIGPWLAPRAALLASAVLVAGALVSRRARGKRAAGEHASSPRQDN
ncbi:MAG: apolipoprotein N-acyltransferase [Candidatus Hydrogenedentes bacterium]|nr:apolipoprotein N-acyltransferase [Candidatus Hydrogenedentota bacterium]